MHSCGCADRRSFYDTGAALSPVPARLVAASGRRLFALAGGGRTGPPQVGPACAREPLGFSTAPGLDLRVIAGGEHGRDRTALPELRPRVLRIFQQAVAEALLRARGLLAHDAGDEPDT